MLRDLILIVDSDLPGRAAEYTLEAAGLRVVRAKSTSDADIVAAGIDATALIVQWAPITASLLDKLRNLRFISRLGIGYDMVDVDAASKRGILVANTPAYCTEEVTTHTLAMILSLARGLSYYGREVHASRWAAVTPRPVIGRPSSMVVGVIGYGRIGSLVARSCAALGFTVVIADPFVDADVIAAAGFESTTREDAIARADILTLHAPLTDQTRRMIDAASLATMKRDSVIVNTCRGPLIDEEALADAIESGHIAGAGLDVFAVEPLAAESRLRRLEGVLLTPHAAWYSAEALLDLPVEAATNVVDFLAGRTVPAIVNTDAAVR